MSQITLPLPERALSVTKKPFAVPASIVFSLVIFLGLAGALAWWQGPGLWRDWQIHQNPATLENWDLIHGECNSRRGFTDCEADVRYVHKGQSYEKHISLAFFDLNTGDYDVELVIERNNPELATLSLGLDMIWNRLIVFSIFMLIFVGGSLSIIIGAFQALGGNRGAKDPSRLTVVPVDIVQVNSVRGAPLVAYNYAISEKKKRQTRTKFAKGQDPLIGLDENGNPVGIAVKLDNLKLPVLLDTELKRIEMTDSERETALAAYYAEQEQRGAAVAEAAPARPKRNSILRGIMVFLLIIVLAVVAVLSYWVYYAMAAQDAFDPIGIEINNLMPEPLNTWACEQLYTRFGDERAPFGCVADDYRSWLVAPEGAKVKSD